jgi:hypothetical protein
VILIDRFLDAFFAKSVSTFGRNECALDFIQANRAIELIKHFIELLFEYFFVTKENFDRV